MKFFIDIAFDSLKKHGEELCGDMVEVIRMEECTIIVLADGLGSGVKANILSTLTSKIAITMLKEGADIYETVDTIVNTLPVCNIRNIAYSTFTIIKIYNDGNTYIAEYDNPSFFMFRNNKSLSITKKDIVINEKKVKESNFVLRPGDVFTVVSDGVIHAGLGEILNLGWSWENVNDYLERNILNKRTAQNITNDLISVCWDLYGRKPGDDTTVVTIKIIEHKYVTLFTGPPKDKEKDNYVVNQFITSFGKKVICGGTTANIVERELNRKLQVNLDFISKDIPPTATMEGIDLITEGVLTLSKTVEKIKSYTKSFSEHNEAYNAIAYNSLNNNQGAYDNDSEYNFDETYDSSINIIDFAYDLDGTDGVSRLCKLLIEECTHLTLWVGTTINPAHQNPNLPIDLSIKLKLIDDLCELLRKLGKTVKINYL